MTPLLAVGSVAFLSLCVALVFVWWWRRELKTDGPRPRWNWPEEMALAALVASPVVVLISFVVARGKPCEGLGCVAAGFGGVIIGLLLATPLVVAAGALYWWALRLERKAAKQG